MGGLLPREQPAARPPTNASLIVEVGQGEGRQWLVLGARPRGITTRTTCPASGTAERCGAHALA